MMKYILHVAAVLGFMSTAQAAQVCFDRTTPADQLPASVCVRVKTIDFAYGSLKGDVTVDGDFPGILHATRELAGEDVYEIHATLTTFSFREPGCGYAQRESIDLVLYATEHNEIVSEPALIGAQEETQDACHSAIHLVKNIGFTKKPDSALTLEFKHMTDPGNPEMPAQYETLLLLSNMSYKIHGDDLVLQGRTSSGENFSFTLSSHKPTSTRDYATLSFGTLSGNRPHGLAAEWSCTTTRSKKFPQGRAIECSYDWGWYTTTLIELPE